MKPFIKCLELTAAIIIGMPVLFNITFFPIIIVKIALVVCAAYYYLMSCFKYENNDIHFYLKKISFLSLSITCVGILFRLIHLPGGSFMILIGSIIGIPMLIYYLTHLSKKEELNSNEASEKSENKPFLIFLKVVTIFLLFIIFRETCFDLDLKPRVLVLLPIGALVALPAIIKDGDKTILKIETKHIKNASIAESVTFTHLGMLIRLCVLFAAALKLFLLNFIVYFIRSI